MKSINEEEIQIIRKLLNDKVKEIENDIKDKEKIHDKLCQDCNNFKINCSKVILK